MKISMLFLTLGLLMGSVPAGPASAQTDAAVPMPTKRLVTPDTPQNLLLVDAVERGDLSAVRAALAQGASADTRMGWEGQPGRGVPVALLATQYLSDKREQELPIFRLLIENVLVPNTADENFGRTLLMAAVELGDLDSVKRLVEKGADVNAQMKSSPAGASALYYAVEQSDERDYHPSPVIVYLLAHGATVNAPDADGRTPLMLAAQSGKTAVVRTLLAGGADPALRDKRGWTALRWAAAGHGGDDVMGLLRDRSPMDLYEAAQFGDVSRLRTHLDAGEDPNAPNAQGTTPLMAAMKSGSVETARLLLDRGADVNGRRHDGTTALHLAALYGDAPLAGLLLSRGADVNAVAHKTYETVTPLTNAVTQAQADVVALLLKRGVDLKRGLGADALEIAIREAGNGLVLRPRDIPRTRVPRGAAVYDARERIIELLLDGGADVRADHSRVLYQAASDGQAGLVELLLNKGADVNARGPVGPEYSYDDGETALLGAIKAWRGALVDKWLMKRGASSGSNLEDIRQEERFARRSVELLLAHGADANLPDARGVTPLMQCVGFGLPALAKMLLNRGAKMDTTDSAGRTALMRAAAENDLSLATLLLGRGAGVDHRDKTGVTALMLAIDDGSNDCYRSGGVPAPPIHDGHPAMVRLLLRHGADVHAVSQSGATALSLARKGGFTQVVALLKQAGAE